jgi:hypothetical protein
MAQIFPSIENIERLKVKPQPGEKPLLDYLIKTLDDSFEIYFQPFLNGDRPDIVIMKKNYGVTIIEVKAWNLKSYGISKDNSWYLQKNKSQSIASPFAQVFNYKSNLYGLHINGLFEKKLENPSYWKIINPFVYFYDQTKDDLNQLYKSTITAIQEAKNLLNQQYSVDKTISWEGYDKKMKYLDSKHNQLNRDKNYISITDANLNKITKFYKYKNILFNQEIYDKFKQILQPPYHELTEGIHIDYTKKQNELSVSKNEFRKIKGVAGSGKTVVLAKRAVNAHKRHTDIVLLLSYNLTLKSYIHDRISDVREGFSWEYFYINNYHQLIIQTANQIGIKLFDGEQTQETLEQIFSNLKIFESKKNEIEKYKTILIDETQDYQPEWIKIVRKYFLEENGEMILFGDEKQNIYKRDLDAEKNFRSPNGFGSWQILNKSIRQKENSHILTLANGFQKDFLINDYNIDSTQNNFTQQQITNLGLNKVLVYPERSYSEVVKTIYENIDEQNIHPNDVSIISSEIKFMQEIDYIIRNETNHKTMVTFESKEQSEKLGNNLKAKKDLRRSKKVGFNLNPGLIKLSTTHSFKGFESPTLFLIISKNDSDEMIYSAITRAKFNIMVFVTRDSKYIDFFQSHLETSEFKKT